MLPSVSVGQLVLACRESDMPSEQAVIKSVGDAVCALRFADGFLLGIAVGMADGSFRVFDVRGFKSYGMPRGGSGHHHSAITAASWVTNSYDARVWLALGSVSTIKVTSKRHGCSLGLELI